jgi:hypothetical protein
MSAHVRVTRETTYWKTVYVGYAVADDSRSVTTYRAERGPWEAVRYNPKSTRKIPQWAATAIRSAFPDVQIPAGRIKP